MNDDLVSRSWLLEQLNGLGDTRLIKRNFVSLVTNAPAVFSAPVPRCHGGGELGMIGITKDEFLDEICKRCTVDQRVKTGILTEDDAREECDCCACIMIAGMICDAAGIE